MTRSSRHKSSKHSSREARDYSDSEKDSSVKERKGKEDSSGVRVLKETEKRKLDSKESRDVFGSGNGEYAVEYFSSSKRRKDRASDDGVSDRWGGGREDERIESSRKSKGSSESSRSKRRDDSEEQRSKSEGKHRESSQKESREERKVIEGKSERFVESEVRSRASNNKTDSNTQDQLLSPASENQLERRVRRRDSSGVGDKHELGIGDINDSRRDDVANDGRLKDEKHKDDRYRDKYQEDLDWDSRHRDEKQRHGRPGRDLTNNRSDDKHLKDEKDAAETRQQNSKLQETGCDRDHDYNHDHEYIHACDFDRGCDQERDRDRDHDHDHDRNYDHDFDCIRDHDEDCEWDRERNRQLEQMRDCDRDRRDRDRERERDQEPDRDRNLDFDHYRERDVDNNGSHLDDCSFKYKDSKGKKRYPDECDDDTDAKSRGRRAHYSDKENNFLSGRVESDADRGRSQSCQAYVDSTVSSNRQRTSPSTSSHCRTDEYKHIQQEDSKYSDYVAEQRPKTISSKEVGGFSGASESGSKYRSIERSIKTEDGHLGEITVERSSSSKVSPMALVERSSSSTSLDRRYMIRNGTRRSLDIEETGWRRSISLRELSAAEDRLSWELPLEKPLMDESIQMDLRYYNKTNQSYSSSSLPPSSAFRAGVGSPSLMGSLEEDVRVNISGRYRRSGDPGLGRGQGNAWRGTPNWSSPVPNGFIHFHHGPPHGGCYPAMMSQFPSPSMFSVRSPMEMNNSGIPYHIHDADRFGGHLRPLGWQNMVDGSGPPHLHGWDGNNGSFRDEPHMFGGADWDQNRHPMNGRRWETSSADMWKGENGDANMDLPSTTQEDHPMQAPLDDAPLEDELAGQEGLQAQHENNHGVLDKSIETRSISSAKESFNISSKTADDETPGPPKVSSADKRCCAYLSKLDISMELAGSGLYSQCMILLGLDQTANVDKDAAVIVNLKDGGRAVSKSSKSLLSATLFPAANDSVFQRAMDHYKKQRVQMSGLRNGGTLDIISTSSGEKVEQGALCVAEKTTELVLVSDTDMMDAPILTSDHDKSEAVTQADVQETMEELVSTPYLVAKDHNHTPEPNLKEVDQEYTLKSSEETVPAFNGDKVDEMSSEKVTSADAYSDNSPSSNNATQATNILPADGDNLDDISNTKDNSSVFPAEERQGVADATTDPLFFPESSPKVTGALMPGSNVSESVILSRIHLSFESTH